MFYHIDIKMDNTYIFSLYVTLYQPNIYFVILNLVHGYIYKHLLSIWCTLCIITSSQI